MDDVKNLSFFAPIEKTDDEQRMVYGYASTEALDSQGEIVKKEALKGAIADYMKFANIREMHQPSAVGKAKQANIDKKGLYLAAKVVDDKAWEKVKEGVYSGFSIGGRVKQMVDNEITELSLSEISLVDRPANPEAVFDVFKADNFELAKAEPEEEPQPEAQVEEPKEEEKVQKDVYGASFLVDLACNLSYYIESEKFNKEDTKDLERALKSIKAALVDEIKEPEYFESLNSEGLFELSEAVEMAKKALETPAKESEAVEKAEEPQPEAEKTEEVKPEDEKPATEEPKEEEEKQEKEAAEEVRDIVKVVNDKINEGSMPDDKELDELLKAQDIEVTENNRNIMRFEIAGLIVKAVQAHILKTTESDAAKSEAEKVLDEANVEPAKNQEERNIFHKILGLIETAEVQLKKEMNAATPEEVAVPPSAPEDPKGNPNVTEALAMLQRAVEILSANNAGGAMTPTEENKERNGTSVGDGSTGDGGGHISASEETGDLNKIEELGKDLDLIKNELKKLQETPMPVKIKASYQTVEKTESEGDKKSELEKAEKRAGELHELMKQNPNNTTLQKEANSLSAHIMKLRREVNN